MLNKIFSIKIESIELFFNYYTYENLLRQKYEKYNLFELIILLDNSVFKSELNKKAIIDTFVNNKYDIEYKVETLEDHNINWKYDIEYKVETLEDHNINWKSLEHNKQLYSIIILDNNGKDIMQIFNDDIIKIDDKEYNIYMSSDKCIDDINKYHNVSYVKLKNLETNIKTKFTKQEFIDIFKNNNITYKNSLLINRLNGNKLKTMENK
jgi:hypothetical protein